MDKGRIPDTSTLTVQPSWLDLPDYLIDAILEGLPVADYVRFAVVCAKWLFLQKAHRRTYSPHPLPTFLLPWLFISDHLFIADHSTLAELGPCYRVWEKQHYRFVISPREFCKPHPELYSYYFARGWMLLYPCPWFNYRYGWMHTFTLVNPISKQQIQILRLPSDHKCVQVALYVSPSLPPDRDFSILAKDVHNNFYLFRSAVSQTWNLLKLPPPTFAPVSYAGHFYCLYEDQLLMVDPFGDAGAPAVVCLWIGGLSAHKRDIASYSFLECSGDCC